MSLEPKKLDLHVHSPASHDFDDKTVTPEKFIHQAIGAGLDAIAVTDHNSVDWIDLVNAAAKDKKFVVFPGMEISCGGAENGSIHVLGIFEPRTPKDTLQKILGRLEIKGSGKDSFTSKGVSEVINIIRAEKGLAILAHANSKSGALNDIKGNPRIEIVQNSNLSAVQATDGDFAKQEGSRLCDYLNGKDPNYKRKLAVIRASDNGVEGGTGHTLDSIGKYYTYFKMGELTLESLRQCFEDPDTRIIQTHEAVEKIVACPNICEVEVSGGFLSGQIVKFHSGMNSVIGGTGTGKSLLVEFMRFAFNKKPAQSQFKDHKDKLKHQLGANGEIKIKFFDSSNEQYELIRKYDASLSDPYDGEVQCKNLSSGEQFDGNVNAIFPVLMYSQNEIVEITKDYKAQLALLDNFRDFKKYRDEAQRIKEQLENLDHELIQSMNQKVNLPALKKDLHTTKAQLQKVENKIKTTIPQAIFDQYMQLSEEREAAEQKIAEYDSLIEFFEEAIENFDSYDPGEVTEQGDLINSISLRLSGSYEKAKESLGDALVQLQTDKAKAQKQLKSWEIKNKYAQSVKAYEKASLKEEKKKGHENARQELLGRKRTLEQQIQVAERASTRFDSYKIERDTLLTRLAEIRKQYSNERKEQSKLITDRSNQVLQINLKTESDKDIYKKKLLAIKAGSYAEETEVSAIVEQLTPVELVNLVLTNNAASLSKSASLTKAKAESIIKELSKADNIRETLRLQYDAYPEDSIEILYRKKDSKYYTISQLSMGQKADALMMIALGDSAVPVIVDQPEDALDVSTIWHNICTRLRLSKHSRQFIFTTHNSSVAVSSDSDQFIILDANGGKGWVEKQGTIEESSIRTHVLDHLEGGEDSYNLKRRKYGI